MKTIFYTGRLTSANKFFASLFCIFCVTTAVTAQTYYSNFQNTAGQYNATNVSGCAVVVGLGTPPTFTNVPAVATDDLGDYAGIASTVSVSTLCSNSSYAIRTRLNLPVGTTEAPAGCLAGFRVMFGGAAGMDAITNNITINTYKAGIMQETVNGSGLIGINSSLLSGAQSIYFITAQPFDEVELRCSMGILDLSIGVDYRFYYAFASVNPTIILPVKLTSFTAATEGKNIRLNWATASEVNAARYELERSSNNGRSFTTISTTAAGGTTSGEMKYNYVDGVVPGGEYLYRLKMIDKDGAFERSHIVSVKTAPAANWQVYPTMLTRGTSINVVLPSGSTGKAEIQLTTLQGQTVQTAATNDNKLSISTGHLPAGMYLLKLYHDGKPAESKKIIVQ